MVDKVSMLKRIYYRFVEGDVSYVSDVKVPKSEMLDVNLTIGYFFLIKTKLTIYDETGENKTLVKNRF